METKEKIPQEEMWQKWDKEHRRGKIAGGIVIVIAGSLFLARELGVIFPWWFFTWKTLIIGIGLFVGIKHGFRDSKWLIPVIIGSIFLIADLFPELAIKPLLWPLMVILIGLFIIFKPHNKYRRRMHWEKWHRHHHRNGRRHWERWQHYQQEQNNNANHWDNYGAETNNEDIVDYTAFMAGIKKNILSKNFKHGDVTAVLAGTKINFTQADFKEKASLEVTAVFGGVQLIIPGDWEVKSEVVCVFGSVEDKRMMQPNTSSENQKVLTLRGTVFFGGIEIRNY